MSIKYETVVGGELFKWDVEGKKIEGVLMNYTHKKDTGKGPGHVYEVKTKDGTVAFFAPFLLNKQLTDLPIPSIVDITLSEIGETKTGNTLKIFTVKHAPVTDENLKLLGVEIRKRTIGEGEEEGDGFNGL